MDIVKLSKIVKHGDVMVDKKAILEKERAYSEKVNDFMGKDWIDSEMNRAKASRKKGGVIIAQHPFIRDYEEIHAQVFRAEVLKEDTIIMGKGHSNLVELGKCLLELEGNYNEEITRNRLRSKENYESTVWELKVISALNKNGAVAKNRATKNEKGYDIVARINDKYFAVECKKKIVEDAEYKSNLTKAGMMAKAVQSTIGKILYGIDIRIIINDILCVDDVPEIRKTARDMIYSGVKKSLIVDKYVVEVIDEYLNVPAGYVTGRLQTETICTVSGSRTLEEVYTEKVNDHRFKNRVFVRLREGNAQVKNFDDLLCKANKQLSNSRMQSSVFIEVPMHAFDECLSEVKRLFNGKYENIGCVNLVASEKEHLLNVGVKLNIKTKCVLNEKPKIKMHDDVIEFLNKNPMFQYFAEEKDSMVAIY